MTQNEDPGPCIVVIGIVMAVGDWVLFDTGFLIFVAVFIVFIGIAVSSTFKKKRSSTLSRPLINNTQNNTQIIEKFSQNITQPRILGKSIFFAHIVALKPV